jgi:SPP1 gp7 family putative phage head morphogenesis protein
MADDNTVNEELFNALVRHQILLLRLSSTMRMRIQRLLDKTEEDIADRIRSRLLNNTGLQTTADQRRLEALLAMIRKTRLDAWEQVTEAWLEDLQELSRQEPELMRGILQTVAPVQLSLAIPAVDLLKALVTTEPFKGQTLSRWASTIAQADLRRIEDQVRMGMIAGESSAEIARRVVGSARLRGTDGVTQITRREAESITRTAVNHISNAARRQFILANSDLFHEEQFVATLDARTTPVCRSLDGHRYKTGHGPIPPLHFNCRSLRVPVIDGHVLGMRPFKASTSRQLLREYADEAGLDKVPATRDALPRGHKGAFDEFARRRVRELTGRVPGKTTYQEWLSGQPAQFQDDVLGPTRGALFRRGGLTLDKFVNQAGDEIPLSDLARLHAEAFRAAGLDPGGFM